MGAVVQVDAPAEGPPPGGVVEAAARPGEGHPVGDEGLIVVAGESAVSLLAPDPEDAAGGPPAGLAVHARDEVGLILEGAVFIIPQVLPGQVGFHVGGADVPVDAVPALAGDPPYGVHGAGVQIVQSGLDGLLGLGDIHLEAVGVQPRGSHGNRPHAGGVEGPPGLEGVVLVGQAGDVVAQGVGVDVDGGAVGLEPVLQRVAVQDLLGVGEVDGDAELLILLPLAHLLLQASVVGVDCGLLVAAALVQVHGQLPGVEGVGDGGPDGVVVQGVALYRLDDGEAVVGFLNVGVHRGLDGGVGEAGKGPELVGQGGLVKGDRQGHVPGFLAEEGRGPLQGGLGFPQLVEVGVEPAVVGEVGQLDLLDLVLQGGQVQGGIGAAVCGDGGH